MTAMPHPVPRGWERPDETQRASDRRLADFLDRTARRGPRSPFERERVAAVRQAAAEAQRREQVAERIARESAAAVERLAEAAAFAAITERQTRLAERLLGITEEDR